MRKNNKTRTKGASCYFSIVQGVCLTFPFLMNFSVVALLFPLPLLSIPFRCSALPLLSFRAPFCCYYWYWWLWWWQLCSWPIWNWTAFLGCTFPPSLPPSCPSLIPSLLSPFLLSLVAPPKACMLPLSSFTITVFCCPFSLIAFIINFCLVLCWLPFSGRKAPFWLSFYCINTFLSHSPCFVHPYFLFFWGS